ncbi:coiled-coil domain-containing protein 187 [Electrophorus electricus]|uniref:Coiled-coil domain-containing protein n=1 Tax=Electrophorus electricus TaxID=8005 RepID=A0A4W4HGV8_ELEEL|nr:coiled-coil domain-containing protein 187 [Electrophorus electricus]XP_026873257.1 coiled-coil domain-containing protein 187 [Electrophorus electricus]
MAELDIDQSNLPSVQEVCQCFAVLEDGALAHNLQEQEIEQYYSSNVQRNQLVQNDLRVAKMLQDEEQQRSYRRHRQADQQLEEQDSEYARRIQDDIQRCAEETRRRDDDDEEMAKQIQEEEELHDRQLNESHTAYGQGHGLQKARASLDLGELKQVLMDEELARRLQAEEEELIRRHPPSVSPSQIRYPEGDFEVAQVAQDEELAHYMQKQEMQANRESRDLDGGRWQEGSMTDVYDEGVDFERQRERLDSEGLRMPTEACSPEFHPPSPIAMATHQLQFRNVAEDLDPTFQRNEHVQTVQNMPGPCPLQTQPAFVPPTKRHSDKPGRVKASGKKETCKQQ